MKKHTTTKADGYSRIKSQTSRKGRGNSSSSSMLRSPKIRGAVTGCVCGGMMGLMMRIINLIRAGGGGAGGAGDLR